MRRGIVAAVVALVVIGGGVALLVARNSGDDGPKSTPIPAGGRLDAGGANLVALLDKGRAGSWHATYKLTRPAGPSEVETLEVWRSPGKTRQDSIVTSGAEPVHTIGIRTGSKVVSCAKTGSGAWRCERVGSAALDPDATFAAAIGEFGNTAVTEHDATVHGYAAKCFSIDAGGDASLNGEVCVSDKGVPLRISREGASIEVVTLETHVSSSAFRPPA